MKGKRFGKLTVLYLIGKDKARNLLWFCECDCGGTTVQRTNTLNMGGVKSCGCYRKEIAQKRMLNEGNPMWRGDFVNRMGLHVWVKRRKLKPEFCERCGKRKPQDLANISQQYKRDPNDYEWLCRKCHMNDDGRMERLKKRNKSETTKQNLSKLFKGKNNPMAKKWIVVDPKGKQIFVEDLTEFCLQFGLSYVCMKEVAAGRLQQHKKGWICNYA